MVRVLIIVFTVVLLGCSSSDVDMKSILGFEPSYLEKEHENADLVSYSGEGFSIAVFKLTKTDIEKFIDLETKSDFPVLKENDRVQYWKQGPYEGDLANSAVELVTNYYVRDSEVKKYQNRILDLLKGDDFYYAFSSKEVLENAVSVEFYFLDIQQQLLIVADNKI